MPKFLLPNAEPGTVIINDRYRFVDGVMPVSQADAPMIARILCEYHGCKLVDDEEVAGEDSKVAESGSLAADITKNEPAAEVKPAKQEAKAAK